MRPKMADVNARYDIVPMGPVPLHPDDDAEGAHQMTVPETCLAFT